jgi:tRNA (guanine-N7-)-methyltransferase
MKKKLYFGRVKSRKISKIKENSLKKYLKIKKIKSLTSKKKLILEIGIGMGENLIHLSKKNIKKNIIGVDPFKNGMVNVSDYCINNNVKNIYLYPHVFQKFINKFKNLRFDMLYILFPDPWPKKRHRKRRIVNEEFLKKIFEILKKKGKFFFSTDNLDYFINVKTIIKNFPNIKVKKINKIVTIKTKFYLKAEKKGNKINSLLISKY